MIYKDKKLYLKNKIKLNALFLLLIAICFLSLSGCNDGKYMIEDYDWTFDCVQSAENDGEMIACSTESVWAENTRIIRLNIELKEKEFTITNEDSGEQYTFSYILNNSVGKSTVYNIEYNDLSGLATVSKTKYSDKSDVPTLIISINSYNLYFYDKQQN